MLREVLFLVLIGHFFGKFNGFQLLLSELLTVGQPWLPLTVLSILTYLSGLQVLPVGLGWVPHGLKIKIVDQGTVHSFPSRSFLVDSLILQILELDGLTS